MQPVYILLQALNDTHFVYNTIDRLLGGPVMARIPDTELERLKREVSLTRSIEAQGLKLISQGKDLACRCPWHDGDDTPSCIVSPKTNLWHCFGCDAGGSVIDWVMRMHRVSFRHACELLAKQHPALAAAPVTTTGATAGNFVEDTQDGASSAVYIVLALRQLTSPILLVRHSMPQEPGSPRPRLFSLTVPADFPQFHLSMGL